MLRSLRITLVALSLLAVLASSSMAARPRFTVAQARAVALRFEDSYWNRVKVTVRMTDCHWQGRRVRCMSHLTGVFFTVDGRRPMQTIPVPEDIGFKHGRLVAWEVWS